MSSIVCNAALFIILSISDYHDDHGGAGEGSADGILTFVHLIDLILRLETLAI